MRYNISSSTPTHTPIKQPTVNHPTLRVEIATNVILLRPYGNAIMQSHVYAP